jgi:hypothetical protein
VGNIMSLEDDGNVYRSANEGGRITRGRIHSQTSLDLRLSLDFFPLVQNFLHSSRSEILDTCLHLIIYLG